MATQLQAEAVHAYVRDFFRNSAKSANKRYPPEHKKFALSEARIAAARTTLRDLRNKNFPVSDIGAYGEAVAAQEADARAGNCTEMSAMAVALVRRIADFGSAWLCDIYYPGDHAFCAVGAPGLPKPGWVDVRSMRHEQRDYWCIDPWANICCRPQHYQDQFRARMAAWARKGKMVRHELLQFNEKDGRAEPEMQTLSPVHPLYLSNNLSGPMRVRE